MSSGASAGLQTAAQVAADLSKRKRDQQARFEAMDADATGKGAQTIYRDSAGRRRALEDVMHEKNEEERRRKETEEIRRREREWAQGSRQKQEREAERDRLRKAGTSSFARTRDDAELNAYQKGKTHWDDPLGQKGKGKKGTYQQKPVYRGPAPQPNRFNIPPGYRWDGVGTF